MLVQGVFGCRFSTKTVQRKASKQQLLYHLHCVPAILDADANDAVGNRPERRFTRIPRDSSASGPENERGFGTFGVQQIRRGRKEEHTVRFVADHLGANVSRLFKSTVGGAVYDSVGPAKLELPRACPLRVAAQCGSDVPLGGHSGQRFPAVASIIPRERHLLRVSRPSGTAVINDSRS